MQNRWQFPLTVAIASEGLEFLWTVMEKGDKKLNWHQTLGHKVQLSVLIQQINLPLLQK